MGEPEPGPTDDSVRPPGVLAYGSLLSDPGEELDSLVAGRIEDVQTPFLVDFAHACPCRDRAPTLAPVTWGGASVTGAILTTGPGVTDEAVREALWRRETRSMRRDDEVEPDPKDRVVRRARPLGHLYGLRAVFYAHLDPNIENRSPEHLAELAIDSARSEAGRREEDGIAYLIGVKSHGISTPLLDPYERAILDRTGADTLSAAREKLVHATDSRPNTDHV